MAAFRDGQCAFGNDDLAEALGLLVSMKPRRYCCRQRVSVVLG
jgi:hypothetical protein